MNEKYDSGPNDYNDSPGKNSEDRDKDKAPRNRSMRVSRVDINRGKLPINNSPINCRVLEGELY